MVPSGLRQGEWKTNQPGSKIWISASNSAVDPCTSCKQMTSLALAISLKTLRDLFLRCSLDCSNPLQFQVAMRRPLCRSMSGMGAALGPLHPSTSHHGFECFFNLFLGDVGLDTLGMVPRKT